MEGAGSKTRTTSREAHLTLLLPFPGTHAYCQQNAELTIDAASLRAQTPTMFELQVAYSLELWEELLLDFIEAQSKGAQEQWVVMGNSIGGEAYMAQIVLVKRPQACCHVLQYITSFIGGICRLLLALQISLWRSAHTTDLSIPATMSSFSRLCSS